MIDETLEARREANGNMDRESKGDRDRNDTPFLAILLYVLGFMLALAALAWLAATLLRHLG